ncbi:hypothetical protein [Robiginitalea sp. SC105]|uniref:hypothetical protein n=1 Tax=Robiginitalea sp. SC105 TaxID=2762332 RepID=UPI0021027F1A|nr:hypothetical protein [Robiginitalea sp. SC105]
MPAQEDLTAVQWQQDLALLKHTVHTDYPFLFKKITPEDFDRAVTELDEAIPQLAPHEILVGLARIVASFGYGHTVLGYWEGKIPYHELPLVFYHYDDGIYLQGVHRDYEQLAGARLLAIEGMPIAEVLERMLPVVPAENEQFTKAYGIHYLTYPEFLHAQGVTGSLKQEIRLSLERDGKLFEATVRSVPAERFPRQYGMVVPGEEWVESRDLSQTPLYLKNLDKIYYYQYLPEEKTVYVRHSQIQDEEGEDIPAFYDRLFQFIESHEVDKLILDVRLNGGGNNYKNKPIIKGIIRSKIDAPGKFMVIIGRRTFSACMNLVNELSTYTNAIFIGEPTSENVNFYGDNRPVTLPNSGINAYLSFAWWQDKPQWENADWLAPHVATGMTFEQYRSNQDPALAAALAFNDSTFICDPMEHLTKLFMGGDLEAVRKEAAKMVEDPDYRFFDFEGEFDQTAARLMESGRLDEAIYVNSLNLEFFPESPGVWLRQGEILSLKGDLEGARAAFEKVQSLATGSVGKQAGGRLAALKGR